MKKFNILALTILMFCAIGVVKAATATSYEFKSVGQFKDGNPVELKEKVTPYIHLNNDTPAADVELAFSISRKNWLGQYSLYSRIHQWTKGKYTWDLKLAVTDKKSDYKPTVVYNAQKAFGGYVRGSFYLYSK